ncbi:MAG: nucleoside hydrolase, partial [Planctomycetota bacterium]
GSDIDDTWALVMLLNSPEFDIKLIVSDSGNDIYRAKIIAKMLETAKRTDIPVGIGCRPGDNPGRQSAWVGDYRLEDYPGTVHKDGVAALIDTIRKSDEPVTLICIGPVPNIAEALKRAPDIASRARFVGMHGSVYKGYGNSDKISPEYNVRAAPEALQAVFRADWEITLTPLDTCGIIHLTGEKFAKVYHCPDPVIQALMANYQAWREAGEKKKLPPPDRSSTLFDTVAVYLGYTEALCEMETVPLSVTDDGYTRIDPEHGRPVRCALRWKDLGAYEDHLVQRLIGG